MAKSKEKKTPTTSVQDAVDQLSSDSPTVRRRGAIALGRLGAEAEPAVSALVDLIDDESGKVARAVTAALRDIGPTAREAVPALMSHIADDRTQVRLFVHAALKNIGPEAFALLRDQLLASNGKCSKPFSECFVGMGRTCFDELLPMLDHKEPAVRKIVYNALSTCEDQHRQQTMELFVDGLNDRSQAVRKEIKEILRYEVFLGRKGTLASALRQASAQKGAVGKFTRELLERLCPEEFQEQNDKHLQQLLPQQGPPPVRLAGEIVKQLELKKWNRLSAAQRKKVQSAITEALTESKYNFRADGLHRYGPSSSAQCIPAWRDADDRRFVLIPGGTFRPGFDDAQLKHLRSAMLQLESVRKFNPKKFPVFNSEIDYCDVSQKRETTVMPLLMAAELIDTRRAKKQKAGQTKIFQPNLSELAKLLTRMRWTLPSSVEFEWAVLGGKRTIFHWGNRPGKFVRQERVLPEHDDQRWPYCTRFGLTAPLNYVTWCQPQGGDFPIVTHGGAAGVSPWQDCMEWALYLTSVHARHQIIGQFNHRFDAAVRPVIRFSS